MKNTLIFIIHYRFYNNGGITIKKQREPFIADREHEFTEDGSKPVSDDHQFIQVGEKPRDKIKKGDIIKITHRKGCREYCLLLNVYNDGSACVMSLDDIGLLGHQTWDAEWFVMDCILKGTKWKKVKRAPIMKINDAPEPHKKFYRFLRNPETMPDDVAEVENIIHNMFID